MLHYYAQRKCLNSEGTPQTPANYPYTDRREAERQYYLLNAAACQNTDNYQMISIELGTIELGVIERRFYDYTPAPEPEPETEGE